MTYEETIIFQSREKQRNKKRRNGGARLITRTVEIENRLYNNQNHFDETIS